MSATPDAVMRRWFQEVWNERRTGRHVGDALGGPATGRSIDIWGTTIGRVRDVKIVEGWNTFDFLTMYQQIGWVKSSVVGE